MLITTIHTKSLCTQMIYIYIHYSIIMLINLYCLEKKKIIIYSHVWLLILVRHRKIIVISHLNETINSRTPSHLKI